LAGTDISFDNPVPAIVQDYQTGRVLMLGYMNREAYLRTLETGFAWFWSRSRGRLWQKGETSGHTLKVRELRYDCDGDAILIVAEPSGPTCHTGEPSCFFHKVDPQTHEVSGPFPPPSFGHGTDPLQQLSAVIRDRREQMPSGSYTAYLLREGIDKIAKKLGEEVAEVIVAAKNGVKQRVAEETADLVYHVLVMLEACQVEIGEVYAELAKRRSLSVQAREETHNH
jgi:phosphoribosyl-ATP pyrophosphohydrolase/phosphoribosyl-AMP cyclohydrolase